MDLQQLVLLGFGAVAGGGLLLALRMLAGRLSPRWLRSAHGLAGLALLCALFGLNLIGQTATPERAWWAFGVLLLGFIAGLLLLRVLFRSAAPFAVVLLHGVLGVAGIALLYSVAMA